MQEFVSPNEAAFRELQGELDPGTIQAFIAPRGIGLSDWRRGFSDDQTIARKEIQIRRRYMQVGQTLDGMRVWDLQRCIQAIRQIDGFDSISLTLEAKGHMAVNALYASIFEPEADQLVLTDLPASHRDGPDYLNVLRTLDIPTAVALAAEKAKVRLIQKSNVEWPFPENVSRNLGWPENQFSIIQSNTISPKQ
jgi:hypothetical protein